MDRLWLVDKCLLWGSKLDLHLADLQGSKSIDEVRQEANATIANLVESFKHAAGKS